YDYFFSASCLLSRYLSFFFYHVASPPEIYTLSLHDALPISSISRSSRSASNGMARTTCCLAAVSMVELLSRRAEGWHSRAGPERSEEHTSELQSHLNLVCRLLLEKKKNTKKTTTTQEIRTTK